MTSTALRRLTRAALRRHFSAPQATRLWGLHQMGVSLGTLSRAWKVLKGFGVTSSTDHEWSFFTDVEQESKPLYLWHERSGTWIALAYFGNQHPFRVDMKQDCLVG